MTSKITKKTGPVVDARIVDLGLHDVLVMSTKGKMIRLPLKSVAILGRATQGVILMRLDKDDKVASLAIFIKEEAKEEIEKAVEGVEVQHPKSEASRPKAVPKAAKKPEVAKAAKVPKAIKVAKKKSAAKPKTKAKPKTSKKESKPRVKPKAKRIKKRLPKKSAPKKVSKSEVKSKKKPKKTR